MSTTTTPQPDLRVPELVPVLPGKYAWQLKHLLVCLSIAVFFVYTSYIPLFHSDIWGHVNYGKWILEHRTLPVEDPFTPLAQGVPLVDTAWLGQVLFAFAERIGGAEWISDLYAVTVLCAYLLIGRTFYLRTGGLGATMATCAVMWTIGSTRHAIVRPEIFGGLCFAILFWLIAKADAKTAKLESDTTALTLREKIRREPLALWIGVPLLFVAWANLHGSFIVGLGVLACLFVGRVIEVAWKTRDFEAVMSDWEARRWLFIGELAAAAVLINPYGMDLYINVLRFSKNENLTDVLEWFPLKLTDFEGLHFGGSIILLLVLMRHSRRKVKPAEVLLLTMFALSVAPSIRMIGWYAVVFAYVIAPHIADVLERLWAKYGAGTEFETVLTAPSFRYTAFSLLTLWVGFAFTPTANIVLGGKPRKQDVLYSRGTPFGVTEYLRKNPPQGQIWNPQWWGDWLAWDGPKDMQVFMTTNAVHVAPRRVWRDYMTIAQVTGGWDRLLDKYRVNTIVLHKELELPLVREVRRLAGWKIVYEDNLGMIAQRTEKKES